MGAVKERSSNLYAQKLAEQGFIALAIDQSFWGESGGQPHNVVAPDLYVEAFSREPSRLFAYGLVGSLLGKRYRRQCRNDVAQMLCTQGR
jgi:fermentation-respiration switch protein FrsA (DUF1100 family)